MDAIKKALQSIIVHTGRPGHSATSPAGRSENTELLNSLLDTIYRMADTALSELEARKELDIENAAMMIYPVCWVEGIGGPHDINQQARIHAEEALRYARDHGYLSPQPTEPPRYAREGPPIQMQDVLLACGELNERERVAVRWVLDKVNELPEQPRDVMSKDYDALYELLCNGGTALGYSTYRTHRTGRYIHRNHPVILIGDTVLHDGDRHLFASVCNNIGLEWIAVLERGANRRRSGAGVSGLAVGVCYPPCS